jgi:hypothetical protein
MIIPEGSYKLEVEGKGLVHEWYQDAIEIGDAKVLEIKCNQAIEIGINVGHAPEPRHFNVSGKVTSEKDGSPVPAVIQFMPAEWLNRKDNNDKNDKPNPAEFSTKTDENGNYSIDLPEALTYVAHAMPLDPKIYSDQFYDKVASPTEADLINLESDVSDINFVLKERAGFKNEFRGMVINEEGVGLKSRVIASFIGGKNSNNKGRFSYFSESDETGKFTFKNLVPGDYVLLSIPMDNNFVPGYYKIGEIAVLKWREATRIAIGDNSIDVVCEIKHRQRSGQKGIIQVSGTITELFGITKSGDKPQGGSIQPVAGAFVYVVDGSNNIINYSFSDNTGLFTLEELPQGAARVIADKPGYGTYEMNLDLDMKNASMGNLNMNMTPESETGIDDNILPANASVRVYPSPVGSNATVEFNAEAGKAVISISKQMNIKKININKVDYLTKE